LKTLIESLLKAGHNLTTTKPRYDQERMTKPTNPPHRNKPPSVSRQAAILIHEHGDWCCYQDLIDGLGVQRSSAKSAMTQLRLVANAWCGPNGWALRVGKHRRYEIKITDLIALPSSKTLTEQVMDDLIANPGLSLSELSRRHHCSAATACAARNRLNGTGNTGLTPAAIQRRDAAPMARLNQLWKVPTKGGAAL
jgi:hypothetical protein